MNDIDRMTLITFMHENIRHSNPGIKSDTLFAMINAILIDHFETHAVTQEEIDTLTKIVISCTEAMTRELNR